MFSQRDADQILKHIELIICNIFVHFIFYLCFCRFIPKEKASDLTLSFQCSVGLSLVTLKHTLTIIIEVIRDSVLVVLQVFSGNNTAHQALLLGDIEARLLLSSANVSRRRNLLSR